MPARSRIARIIFPKVQSLIDLADVGGVRMELLSSRKTRQAIYSIDLFALPVRVSVRLRRLKICQLTLLMCSELSNMTRCLSINIDYRLVELTDTRELINLHSELNKL